MDRRYVNALLREAVADPSRLIEREKFWKLDFWNRYLRRCDDILFNDPEGGLALTLFAPQLATKIAELHPGVNGADLFLIAYSYLGGAYRRIGDYPKAEEAFCRARPYRDSASPKALAEHYRRLAYLLLFQHDPACFPTINDAITIHRNGSIVYRHELGECLLCRGHAYFEFNQPGRSLVDLTAALNCVSIKIDHKPWYCALYNLTNWAVQHGSDEELEAAYANLKPAQALLTTFWGRPYLKLHMRWIIALVESRLGAEGRAEIVLREVKAGLVEMRLGYEVGVISIDLALIYLRQDRHSELEALVQETAGIFRDLGVEPKAQEALNLWRQAEEVTEDLLINVRDIFFAEINPMITA